MVPGSLDDTDWRRWTTVTCVVVLKTVWVVIVRGNLSVYVIPADRERASPDVVQEIFENIASLSRAELTLKSDHEPSIMQVHSKVKEARMHDTGGK